jgi:hypothetical protein
LEKLVEKEMFDDVSGYALKHRRWLHSVFWTFHGVSNSLTVCGIKNVGKTKSGVKICASFLERFRDK